MLKPFDLDKIDKYSHRFVSDLEEGRKNHTCLAELIVALYGYQLEEGTESEKKKYLDASTAIAHYVEMISTATSKPFLSDSTLGDDKAVEMYLQDKAIEVSIKRLDADFVDYMCNLCSKLPIIHLHRPFLGVHRDTHLVCYLDLEEEFDFSDKSGYLVSIEKYIREVHSETDSLIATYKDDLMNCFYKDTGAWNFFTSSFGMAMMNLVDFYFTYQSGLVTFTCENADTDLYEQVVDRFDGLRISVHRLNDGFTSDVTLSIKTDVESDFMAFLKPYLEVEGTL